jgi:16S rRNA processing protein RimM
VSQVEATAVGRISKTFGLNGELVIHLYDTFSFDNPTGESVYVEIDGIWTPLFFASFRRRGQSKAVAVFDDLESEYRASEMVGKEFFTLTPNDTEESDTEEDELYLEELVGYALALKGHKGRGEITGFVESEFNPLFEIRWNGTERLIPAADDFIVQIDQRHQLLTMELPDGLLDL